MLDRLGIRSRAEAVVLAATLLLVCVAPLGNEATHPIVLGMYRALLLVLTGAAVLGLRGLGSANDICPKFLVVVSVFFLVIGASILLAPGSHFPGFYVFYAWAFFAAGFIALSRFKKDCTTAWKRTMLFGVVAIGLGFLVGAIAAGKHPLIATFVNPNYFASFLLPGFAVLVAYGIFGGGMNLRSSHRILALAGAAILYTGIILAASRGAMLAALAILGLAVLRASRTRVYPVLTILLVAAVVGGITLAANPDLMRKFTDRGAHDPYNYQRPKIWWSTVKMIADHPLAGVGAGHYYYHAKVYTPAVEGTLARYRKWPNIAHSEYLQFAAELGIPLTLVLFAIVGFLLKTGFARASALSGEERVIQEAGLLAAIGLGAHALVDNNWTVPVMASGLAVISQVDMLPYGAWRLGLAWTPAKRVLAYSALVLVVAHSTLIPTVGLSFNESGHRAYVAGDFKKAELMHSMAVGIMPDHAVLLDNLGMTYFDEFMKTRKIEYLDQAEWLFRGSMAANDHFDVPGGHLETALIQRLTGDVRKDGPVHAGIIEADRQVLNANPYNPFIRRNLAEALYNIGSKAEATEELRRAVELEPNYVPGYLRLAEWAKLDGRIEESREYERTAVELVTRFQEVAVADSFEALMLGRPKPPEPQAQ